MKKSVIKRLRCRFLSDVEAGESFLWVHYTIRHSRTFPEYIKIGRWKRSELEWRIKLNFIFMKQMLRVSGLSYGPASTWICLIFCEGENGHSKLERRTTSRSRGSNIQQPWNFNSNICDEFLKVYFSFVLNAAFNLPLFTHRLTPLPSECSSSASCAKKFVHALSFRYRLENHANDPFFCVNKKNPIKFEK